MADSKKWVDPEFMPILGLIALFIAGVVAGGLIYGVGGIVGTATALILGGAVTTILGMVVFASQYDDGTN